MKGQRHAPVLDIKRPVCGSQSKTRVGGAWASIISPIHLCIEPGEGGRVKRKPFPVSPRPGFSAASCRR